MAHSIQAEVKLKKGIPFFFECSYTLDASNLDVIEYLVHWKSRNGKDSYFISNIFFFYLLIFSTSLIFSISIIYDKYL